MTDDDETGEHDMVREMLDDEVRVHFDVDDDDLGDRVEEDER